MRTGSIDLGRRPFGAVPLGGEHVVFRVWAPHRRRVAVSVGGRRSDLIPAGGGVWEANVAAAPGEDYLFVLDGTEEWPDPFSRFQPEGLKGPSRIVEPRAFEWTDGAWEGLRLDDLVLYELHVGTFTQEGTFEAVIPRLGALRALGVTALELMPVATFPGNRGWGYDGVYTSAPHPAYGGPEGLARLVDAAHTAGLGIVLDVVYNHVGPGSEGLAAFGPYFSETHETPWGRAPDYTQDGTREWALQNAYMWVRDYHVDGLRLDAVFAVHDDSPRHVLAELADRVHAESPRALVIAETDLLDRKPLEEWSHDAQWWDGFHHPLHVLLTGERDGYYAPFGRVADLAHAFLAPEAGRLVVCAQNHDQVGNRAFGNRLTREQLRVAAHCLLLAPLTPLLFMGEEYGEERPFRFFTDHVDPEVTEATRAGRLREFADFHGFAGGDASDPQDPATFELSRLAPQQDDPALQALYRRLLRLRRRLPPKVEVDADERRKRLRVRRGDVELRVDFAALTAELAGAGPP